MNDLIGLNYYEHQALKSALHQMMKGAIRDLDKENSLRICKRGFEFSNEKTGDTFQVILEVKKVKGDVQ